MVSKKMPSLGMFEMTVFLRPGRASLSACPPKGSRSISR